MNVVPSCFDSFIEIIEDALRILREPNYVPALSLLYDDAADTSSFNLYDLFHF